MPAALGGSSGKRITCLSDCSVPAVRHSSDPNKVTLALTRRGWGTTHRRNKHRFLPHTHTHGKQTKQRRLHFYTDFQCDTQTAGYEPCINRSERVFRVLGWSCLRASGHISYRKHAKHILSPPCTHSLAHASLHIHCVSHWRYVAPLFTCYFLLFCLLSHNCEKKSINQPIDGSLIDRPINQSISQSLQVNTNARTKPDATPGPAGLCHGADDLRFCWTPDSQSWS